YYGVNVSRALMQAVRENDRYKTLSTGRVQGPALNFLAEREREIQEFEPDPYWEIFLHNPEFRAKFHDDGDERIWDEEVATGIFQEVEGEDETVVSNIDINNYTHKPPVPFNLTGLQKEASSQFNINPKTTQSIAQDLYENSLISYPRTESQKLPPKIGYKNILNKLKNQENYEDKAKKVLKKEKNDNLNTTQGSGEDDAHPCFTPETEVSFKPESKTFSELASKVKNWEWDEEKESYYGEIEEPNVISHGSKIQLSKATAIWKTPYDGKILKIKTSENETKVTPKHRFLTITEKGLDYIKAENLTENNIVFEQKQNKTGNIDISSDIDLEAAFSKKHWQEIQEGESRTQKTYQELKKFIQGLEQNKAEKLAAIAGFCFGDGHIRFKEPSENREKYPHVTFTGRKEDMEELKSDIEGMGFSAYITQDEPKRTMLVSKDSVFGRLLIALGCPTGDKMSTEFEVPDWISKNKDIKKEFLAGIFGAELTKVRIHSKNDRDIRNFRFEQNKIEKKRDSFKKFLEQLTQICEDLNIETSNLSTSVKTEERKKDGEKTVRGSFSINNNRENLERFVNSVPMRYSNYKDELRRKASAYLAKRKSIIQRRKQKRKRAKELYDKGKGYKEIGKELDISQYTIKSWVYYGNGGKEEHVPTEELPKFEDFDLKTPKQTEPQIISNIGTKDYEGHVYDIEVEENHNYFANNLLVHNCIYPTGQTPGNLSKKERKIYDLIVKRFFAVFGKPAKRQTLTMTLETNGYTFDAKSKVTKERNWFDLYDPYVKVDEAELPELEEGETLPVDEFELAEKETQPPRRFSQTSIVSELEKRNLGTKATRAQVVDRLYDREFIKNDPIEVTDLGLTIAETLEEYSPEIVSEELTREFEEKMEKIKNEEESKEDALERAREELGETLREFKEKEKEIGAELVRAIDQYRDQKRKLGPCDAEGCDGTLQIIRTDNGRFVGCTEYPDCENTYPLPNNGEITSQNEVCDECGTPKIHVSRKSGNNYEMCIYPDCPTKDDW
ncbi:MAG: DNA topoisomerase, partial [Candidatus Nanohalobium sp.]